MVDSPSGMVAVIVGIDGYPTGDGLIQPLTCAANDAVGVSEALTKVWGGRFCNVRTIVWMGASTDAMPPSASCEARAPQVRREEATRQGILAAVGTAARGARPSDTFLFYFSGHGMLLDDRLCLVTLGDAETGAGTDHIGVEEIQLAVEPCRTAKRVMVLDCCQTREANTHDLHRCLQGLARGWSVFISCSPGEVSLEDRAGRAGECDYLDQGLFTASLVQGLRGAATHARCGSVNLLQLADYVCTRVQVESEERIAEALMHQSVGGRSPSQTRLSPQHPVLLSDRVTMGGPLEVLLAPSNAPEASRSPVDLRRSRPSTDLIRCWLRFLSGDWPVRIWLRSMMHYGGAFWYALAMYFVVRAHIGAGGWAEDSGLPLLVGLGSGLLWWLMVPFAVASNEDRWHTGGYVTGLACLFWHAVVFLAFLSFAERQPTTYGHDPNSLLEFAVILFMVLAAVVIFGCNAVQAIIALAETVRADERREIRVAVQAFRQFRTRVIDVDLAGFVAMVSARPSAYLLVLGVGTALATWSTSAGVLQASASWALVARNTAAVIFMAWQTFWYQAAFKFIQSQVYRR